MFRRPSHQRVLDLLDAFDADLLSRCRFLFGGGTRIVLDLDEYRESQDIDFLCSAYRSAAREDLLKALDAFAADPDHQLRCWQGLNVERPEEIQRGIELLRGELGVP